MTAGGVTLLEACLLGRPIVALALADNQRQAVHGLDARGRGVRRDSRDGRGDGPRC